VSEHSSTRHLLPSTAMLLAFDAAARTGSFTGAARELNLTQSAVSKQIIALEEQLGVDLFERSGHRVELTQAGRVYARDVRAALDLILTASMRVMNDPQGGALNLAVLPTFGTRWLMPRLPGFLAENPAVTVHFHTKLSPFDFRLEHLDAAIHFGTASWPGAESTYLMGEVILPFASPRFVAEHRIESPQDLTRVRLLHISTRRSAWQDWLHAQGVEAPGAEGLYFEQFLTAAQAAAAGLGAVLLPRFLIEGEIERGELMAIFDRPLRSEKGYYLVVPHDRAESAPVAAFKQWLLRTVEEERRARGADAVDPR
jgi:LysR family transcriptional regulator, glycine cleavage system transcriptional activator